MNIDKDSGLGKDLQLRKAVHQAFDSLNRGVRESSVLDRLRTDLGLMDATTTQIGLLRALRETTRRVHGYMANGDEEDWRELVKLMPNLLAIQPAPSAYLICYQHRIVLLQGSEVYVPIIPKDKSWELSNGSTGSRLMQRKMQMQDYPGNHPNKTVLIAPLFLA